MLKRLCLVITIVCLFSVSAYAQVTIEDNGKGILTLECDDHGWDDNSFDVIKKLNLSLEKWENQNTSKKVLSVAIVYQYGGTISVKIVGMVIRYQIETPPPAPVCNCTCPPPPSPKTKKQ